MKKAETISREAVWEAVKKSIFECCELDTATRKEIEAIQHQSRKNLKKAFDEWGIRSLELALVVFDLEDKFNTEISMNFYEVPENTTISGFVTKIKKKIGQVG